MHSSEDKHKQGIEGFSYDACGKLDSSEDMQKQQFKERMTATNRKNRKHHKPYDAIKLKGAIKGKLSQNLEKSSKDIFEYSSVRKGKVMKYEVPLKRLPRIHHLQGFVGTLIDYCEDTEKELGLLNMEYTGMEHRKDIDLFIQGDTFDMNLLIEDHEDLHCTSTEIGQIAKRKIYVASSKAVGLFVNSERIQLVESVTDSSITVYSDPHFKKEEEHTNVIGRLMEVIIMRPLLGKVALFHRLRRIAHSEGNGEEFSAYSLIREFPDLYPNPSSSLQTENETNGSGLFYQCIQQNKSNIVRLLDEMIALSKGSILPEEIKPVFEEYQTTIVTEEVTRDLFNLDKAITWCGFQYSTFHIYVKPTYNESKKKKLAKKISTFLAAHGIMKHELIYSACDLEEYSYIGSVIRSRGDQARRATLGCFATFESSNSSSVCALTAKHFAKNIKGGNIYDEDNRLLGKFIPITWTQGLFDIAAAKIEDERVLNLDTNFRNYLGTVKRANLVEERMDDLKGQSVYLRGAKTKLGVGTIDIPNFQRNDGQKVIKVSPGSFTLKKPHARLAEHGDSGAILCFDDHDQNIHVCSMFIGKFPGEESYGFLPLSHGLKELSRITNGEFKLITYMENSPAQIHAEGDYVQASGSCKYLT